MVILSPYLSNEDLCEKSFVQFSSFQKHSRVHNKERPYFCRLCPDTFTQISNLKRHIKIVHQKEKPFVCEICNEKFGTNSNLAQHIERHKKTESRRVYQCKECDNSYFHHSSLNKHMKMHERGVTKKICKSSRKSLTQFHTSDTSDGQEKRKLSELTFFSEIPLMIKEESIYSEDEPVIKSEGKECSPINDIDHCDCIIKEEASMDSPMETEKCLCSLINHQHSQDCGHPSIVHNDHIDFLVNQSLHYPHGNHCDNHGFMQEI